MERPKRRKYRDNPYTLKLVDNLYYILFRDGQNIPRTVEVPKNIYDMFNQFELDDLKELNEYSRHIEQKELSEESIYNRGTNSIEGIDDYVIRTSTYDELIFAINKLSSTQRMLINDLKTFGFLFESLVEHDLKIYADSFNAKCYHYQDYQDREVDSIIELEDGSWCCFEVKLGANQVDEAAKNLVKLKEQISKEGGKVPSSLCVICGLIPAAYQRPDGVYVVPITSLRP